MKTLNKTAARTFLSLIDGLKVGEAKKIDNTDGAFMAVSVDFLAEHADGSKLYAVAHRFEQNGDLCPDPDVEFYVTDLGIAPTAIDQVVAYRRHVELENGRPVRWSPRGQADLASFCNLWMRNIKSQQGLTATSEAA